MARVDSRRFALIHRQYNASSACCAVQFWQDRAHYGRVTLAIDDDLARRASRRAFGGRTGKPDPGFQTIILDDPKNRLPRLDHGAFVDRAFDDRAVEPSDQLAVLQVGSDPCQRRVQLRDRGALGVDFFFARSLEQFIQAMASGVALGFGDLQAVNGRVVVFLRNRLATMELLATSGVELLQFDLSLQVPQLGSRGGDRLLSRAGF